MNTTGTSKADLITHPIRARIMVALMDRELTTGHIAELLSDVPRASLYRHIRQLAEGGVLEVVREVPVRGTMEKVYAVKPGGGILPTEDVANATKSDHLRHFTSFVNALTELYRAYLGEEGADPLADEVVCNAMPLALSDAEYKEFVREIKAVIGKYRHNVHEPDRRRRIFATIIIPDRPEPLES